MADDEPGWVVFNAPCGTVVGAKPRFPGSFRLSFKASATEDQIRKWAGDLARDRAEPLYYAKVVGKVG